MNANVEIILNQIVEKIKINYDPIKIILFGSYAYGILHQKIATLIYSL